METLNTKRAADGKRNLTDIEVKKLFNYSKGAEPSENNVKVYLKELDVTQPEGES